jgi:hypothetical protein
MSSRKPPLEGLTDRLMVIEFAGAPGAGKTTLAAEAVALLRERGIDASMPNDAARDVVADRGAGWLIGRLRPPRLARTLLWQWFYLMTCFETVPFWWEWRDLGRSVVKGQRRRPLRPRMRLHVLYWYMLLGGRARFLARRARASSVLVMDDAFLHRAAALHASYLEAPSPEQISAYVALVPRPDLVVVPVAPVQLCERRVIERGVWSHSRCLDEAQLSASIANAAQAIELAVGQARARGWSVAEVSTSGSQGQAREELLAALAPLLSTASVPTGERR